MVFSNNIVDYLTFKEKINLYARMIDNLTSDKTVNHVSELYQVRNRIWDMLCEADNEEDRQYAQHYLHYKENED